MNWRVIKGSRKWMDEQRSRGVTEVTCWRKLYIWVYRAVTFGQIAEGRWQLVWPTAFVGWYEWQSVWVGDSRPLLSGRAVQNYRWPFVRAVSVAVLFMGRQQIVTSHRASLLIRVWEFLLRILLLEPCISLIYAWKTNKYTNYWFSLLIMYGSWYMFRHYIAIVRERS
jgi:hypothetical protein